MTKARLIERADAICTRDRARLAERRSKLPKNDDTKALAAALRVYRRSQAQEAATAFGFKMCGLGTVRVENG